MKSLNNPIIGVIITVAIIAGVLFKILHWPGAGQLIIIGASSLPIYILSLTGVLQFKLLSTEEQLSIFGSKLKLLGISLSILIIGLLFKVMHWPGAEVQLTVGLISFTLISIFYTYSFISKKEPITIKPEVILISISMLVLIYGVSVGGSSFSLLRNVTSNALKLENNTSYIIKTNESIFSKEKLKEEESEVFKVTESLNKYINDLKISLYQNTDKLPEEMADTISLSQIIGKDNYDIPTYILGLADPLSPEEGEYTARELKDRIEKFNSITSQFNLKINLENKTHMHSNYEDSWETSMFYHNTLAQVILTLNQIQLEANIICNTILTSNLLLQTNKQQPDTIN